MEDESSNPFENNNNVLAEDVQEKLSSILEKYKQLSDEEKEEFQKGAFDVLLKNLNKLPRSTLLPMWLAPYQPYILFILAISLVVLLLGTIRLNSIKKKYIYIYFTHQCFF